MAYPLETDAERGHHCCHPRARVTFSHHRREPASAELVSPRVYGVQETARPMAISGRAQTMNPMKSALLRRVELDRRQ